MPATPPPNARHRRPANRIAGDQEGAALTATLGREVRATRRRRHLTQAQLGKLVGLEQARISEIERGEGAGAALGVWIALGIALERPFAAAFSRDLVPSPQDAGHLGAQELVLSLARRTGISGTFELPTRPAAPARSIDVGLRDDRRRTLAVIEIWNRMDDLGQATRDHRRKVAEALGLAAALGGEDGPYRVTSCWILRATAANRALVRRYPAIFGASFGGSSRAWARALNDGSEAPGEPGLLWVDLAATRPTEFRRCQA